jgi:hypothetical protein
MQKAKQRFVVLAEKPLNQLRVRRVLRRSVRPYRLGLYLAHLLLRRIAFEVLQLMRSIG